MKNKPNTNPIKSIMDTLDRYNLVIFIVITVGGLIAAILTLNYILHLPYISIESMISNIDNTKLDEVTINKLDKLKTSDNNAASQVFPTGRINPFSE
jgi:type IV secretory pathway component VirB8